MDDMDIAMFFFVVFWGAFFALIGWLAENRTTGRHR